MARQLRTQLIATLAKQGNTDQPRCFERGSKSDAGITAFDLAQGAAADPDSICQLYDRAGRTAPLLPAATIGSGGPRNHPCAQSTP